MNENPLTPELTNMFGGRFSHMEEVQENQGKRLGQLEVDVKGLSTSLDSLSQEFRTGTSAIINRIDTVDNKPAKIGIGQLVAVIGLFIALAGVIITMTIAGIGAFWAAIILLVSPLKEDIKQHELTMGYSDVVPRLTVIEERLQTHEERLRNRLERIESLEDWRLQMEYWRGYQVRATENSDNHMGDSNHPEGVLKEVAELRAKHEALLYGLEKEVDSLKKK